MTVGGRDVGLREGENIFLDIKNYKFFIKNIFLLYLLKIIYY